MLYTIEKFNAEIIASKSVEDLQAVLVEVCETFGFRSAYLLDYADEPEMELSVLDTRPDRMGWWRENVLILGRRPAPEILDTLDAGEIVQFDVAAVFASDHPYQTSFKQLDFAQTTMVPVTHDNKAVGLGGFSGWQDLSQEQKTALQVLTYNLLAQRRALRQRASTSDIKGLTPREREVMHLAAEGKTSSVIASELGMSARTANQHVENVGEKLGTRNRTHTVAEVIRQRLLD